METNVSLTCNTLNSNLLTNSKPILNLSQILNSTPFLNIKDFNTQEHSTYLRPNRLKEILSK